MTVSVDVVTELAWLTVRDNCACSCRGLGRVFLARPYWGAKWRISSSTVESRSNELGSKTESSTSESGFALGASANGRSPTMAEVCASLFSLLLSARSFNALAGKNNLSGVFQGVCWSKGSPDEADDEETFNPELHRARTFN